MVPQNILTQVDDVAADETLHHYDELPETTKHEFPTLVGSDAGGDASTVAAALDDGDVVKFTDYYRVETG
ncbi:MAG: hypothetical protein ABEJ78_00985 [Haloferacaceae archaeon]